MQQDLEETQIAGRKHLLMPFAVVILQRLSSLVDHSRRFLPGSSLVQETRREQAKIKVTRRIERLSGGLWSWATAIFETSRYAFLWLSLMGLVGLYLLPSKVQLFGLQLSLSFFDEPTEASEFLRTLWQVEASVLALSIAVIVFAFQAVSISGYNIKLYEFAQDVHLFPVFYVGIVGLEVNGLVLLGFGNGAPAGGASTWAILVSGASFPLLALLFTNTVHALDPDDLHRSRLVRIREEVSRAVEQEIFERLALNLLENRCQAAGIELQLFLTGSSPPGSEDILAPSAGYVRDINIRKLGSLTEGGLSGVKLLTYIGARVAEGQTVIVLPPSVSERTRSKAKKVIRIEKDED